MGEKWNFAEDHCNEQQKNRDLIKVPFQLRLLKTGGRLIRHARYFPLPLAESSLTRRLFRQMITRVEQPLAQPTRGRARVKTPKSQISANKEVPDAAL